ncbi:YciI family protein [Nocardiopsis valliformis]|uniref:YciI family protein n=1 Tax=Nocardiopsis valliformis TaxID=239974 RepID=UPI00034C9967|nr:YciI family protein [Nocardiopsis valliformis]
MKYLIMLYGTQNDFTMMAGRHVQEQPPERMLSQDDVREMHRFMEEYHRKLDESGELVEARGLTPPAHARRVTLREGATVVTDGPYPETEEVLVGYTIVECASFDRATEIAADLVRPGFEGEWVDVRPIAESMEDLGF